MRKDGIPALVNLKLTPAKKATYLKNKDLVFGISINDDTHAYPYHIIDRHEVFNDVIGGAPVSLTYCTLCGSGVLYKTKYDQQESPFAFGSSRPLYLSNKLIYDQETYSLWDQFNREPVVGRLTNSSIKLEVLPVVTTSPLTDTY